MDSQKGKGRLTMSDSGLGSLGSESDTSPCQGSSISSTNGNANGVYDTPVTTSNSKDCLIGKDSKPKVHNKFIVTYFGSVEIDKRYTQPQFWKVILQWIVAEIKKLQTKQVVCLEIEKGIINGVSCEKDSVLFQHDLHHLSKFSRTHQDTRCFAYVTKASETSFHCHVFQTSEESVVLTVFTSIKDANKAGGKDSASHQVLKQSSEHQSFESSSATSLFEVLYIGKIIVSNKKAPPTFIDDAVSKFQQYENSKSVMSSIEERQRHGSGISVQSLPNNLEKTVEIIENELAKQSTNAGITYSNESNGSAESGSDLSCSSTDNIAASSKNQSPNAKIAYQQLKHSESQSEDSTEIIFLSESSKQAKGASDKLQRTVLVNQHQAKKNRTMLLQIARSDVGLISPDRKRVILKTNFRDISFCSQGIQYPEYFGFISRDLNASSFYCYVFKCVTEAMVEEVMQTLKMSFNAAFQQSAKTHMCELCPMHQLHKLAEEIDRHPIEEVLEIVEKRIEQLNENDQAEITASFNDEDPTNIQDKVEVYMIILRHMCEDRQKDHTHISDPNKTTFAYEFTLTESAKNRHSKFDDLRNRAKKSLTESFETIKERVRNKSGETMRDIFRDRSDSNSFNKSQEGELGFTSPVSSPSFTTKDTSSFSFNSPSPIEEENDGKRDKSSPNKGHILREMRELHEHHSIKKGQSFDNSDDPIIGIHQKDSPLRAMFFKAASKDESTPSPNLYPRSAKSLPPRPLQRTGSWRLSIFERVVTPAKMHRSNSFIDRSLSLDDDSAADVSGVELSELEHSLDKKITSQKCRMLWKKAILETLLLIRMKKNVKTLQSHYVFFGSRSVLLFKARPDDDPAKREKLDYEEITPCLKEVTKVWDQMLNTSNRKEFKFEKSSISQALKDGVPRMKRGMIWLLLVEQHKLNNPGLQKDIAEISCPYEDLLKQLTTHQHAILIDLGRTFPNHPYFSTQLGAGQLSLFNILKAYSLLDEEVGYCQGLSFVAGVLLMHMEEKEAFECMRYMLFVLGFRKQYRPDMKALQLQMYQLSRLLHDCHRDLYEHLDKHEIAPTLYAAPWFLTMFASQFPLGFVARVFDLIFLQGMEVVLKVSLVVLANHKELIKQCDSFESIVDFLKTTLPRMGFIQMERVFNQVYSMDCSKSLNAYEVEYHVLQEEMVSTPQRGEHNHVDKLETANHNLKRQNLDLLEQLQTSHSINRSLELQIHTLHTTQSKLNSHIRTLELERAALLNTMSKIRKVVPEHQLKEAGIEIPAIQHNMTITNSPIHNPSINKLLDGSSINTGVSDLDREVASLMSKMGHNRMISSAISTHGSSKLNVPGQRTRRPSSSEN